MKSCISVNVRGASHIENGKDCEDAICINESEGIYCLSDGVSNSIYGKEGAEAFTKNFVKAFGTQKQKEFLRRAPAHEVRKRVCTFFNVTVSELCKNRDVSNPSLFAATFLACIRTSEEDITIIHAGDGIVFAKPNTLQENCISILSYADNHASGSVYWAGDKEQVNRLRVIRIKASDYCKILLCTDGFSSAYLDPSYQSFDNITLADVFMSESESDIINIVESHHIGTRRISDDISCILYNVNEPVVLSKVKQSESKVASLKNNAKKTSQHNPDIPIIKSEAKQPETLKNAGKVSDSKTTKAKILLILKCIIIMSIIIGFGTVEYKNEKNTQKVFAEYEEQISSLVFEMESLKSEISDMKENTTTPVITSNPNENDNLTDENILNYEESTTFPHSEPSEY